MKVSLSLFFTEMTYQIIVIKSLYYAESFSYPMSTSVVNF